ncbi:MAG: pyrimidine dimer DNA glycosylase/endonuclease V [Pyrobaculum sp.]
MQIFRPYVDWRRSATVLDDRRLGKQRAEAKQVLLAILRKLGVVKDGKTGWTRHPIVLMYFNDGRPFVDDLVGYFNAVVEEWRRRGFRNYVTLEDVLPLLSQLEKSPGTPVAHIHEVEYRRLLILKDPCHYLDKFSEEEVEEVVETEPQHIPGINTWLFSKLDLYREFIADLKRGRPRCSGIFPRR